MSDRAKPRFVSSADRPGTGMEFLQKIVAGEYANLLIGEHLGFLETGEVSAEGRVLQGGRKIAYCEAKLVDGAGKLLAHGTGSCLILPR